MVTSHWENLLEDLFLRVLEYFDFKERVSSTVLVCKRWSTLCLKSPPLHAAMALQLQNTTVPSYLTWLAQSSRRAEKIDITIMNAPTPEEGCPLLPQQSLNGLLARLSTCSPLLRTLAITGPHDHEGFEFQWDCAYLRQGYIWDNWAGSLRLLSQVEHLVLEVEFVPTRLDLQVGPVPQDFFGGMNLKSLSLEVTKRGGDWQPHTLAMERSLLALTRLTFLKLDYKWRPANGGSFAWKSETIPKAIAFMTELRSLNYTSDMDIFVTPELSNLTKLSAIHLSGPMAGYEVLGTFKIPDLQQLFLFFNGSCEDQRLLRPILPLSNTGAFSGLTKLEITSVMQHGQADLPYLLPEAALRQLTGLVHLALRMKIVFLFNSPSVLVVPLTTITPFLTHLDLSENGFCRIPPTITGLERLQCLSLSKCPLRIWQQCLAVLVSLPKLHTLDLTKEEWFQSSHEPPDSSLYAWDAESREMMNSIRERMPELDVQIGPARREIVM